MVAREGRMLARLGAGHINIVRPLEIVLTSRHLSFITEYVPGGCRLAAARWSDCCRDIYAWTPPIESDRNNVVRVLQQAPLLHHRVRARCVRVRVL
jgi:hypothetical protein